MEQKELPDEWITQAEAARRRGVSRQAISKLVKAGRLSTHEVGGCVFVSAKGVTQFEPATKGRKKTPKDA